MTSASEHIDKIFSQLEDLLSINQRNDLAGGKIAQHVIDSDLQKIGEIKA